MTVGAISVKVVTYDRRSRRTWILGSQRVHHGAVGVILTAVGIALIVHDRHDVQWWFTLGDAQAAIERALSTTE